MKQIFIRFHRKIGIQIASCNERQEESMAKRKMPIPSRSGGAKPGKNNMMKQIQQMQEEMLKAQSELDDKVYEAAAGGGAVKAVVNGKKAVTSITIDPDVVDEDDIEMLEDLIMVAVNEALAAAENDSASQMERFTGGMGIPGL